MLAWHSTAWHSMALLGMARHSMALHGMAHHGTARHSTVWASSGRLSQAGGTNCALLSQPIKGKGEKQRTEQNTSERCRGVVGVGRTMRRPPASAPHSQPAPGGRRGSGAATSSRHH